MARSTDDTSGTIRVASYVRMSTDHQRYSIENQADAILSYAELHGMRIVRTYKDEGRSGLTLDGRPGLRLLLDDVQTRGTDFDFLLVYDVSRWGRFQDADESAHYEFICRRAGVQVVYCAEPFENDGSPIATVIKSVKRAMAGEYSRELSIKVFMGQARIIRRGYRLGGAPGTGLRRQLIDAHGNPKTTLAKGERKSIHTDRSILVPGPPDEIELVRRIYRLFLDDGLGEKAIANLLNGEGATTDLGTPWTCGIVHRVLTNEKYIGHNIYNRRSRKLKRPCVANPPDQWIRAENAFTPLIDKAQFARVQRVITERTRRYTQVELISDLQRLYADEGRVSDELIEAHPSMASCATYRRHFGDLLEAYRLAGLKPYRDYRHLASKGIARTLRPMLVTQVVEGIEAAGGQVEVTVSGNLLVVNGELTVLVLVANWALTKQGHDQWEVQTVSGCDADLTTVVRLNQANEEPLDYYLVPKLAALGSLALLTRRRLAELAAYRFDDLSPLYALAARSSGGLAA